MRKLDIHNFVILLNLSGQAIVVEQGINKHIEFLKKGHTNAIAVNLSHCQTRDMTQNILHKVYNSAGIKHQFFVNENKAKTWLLQQLSD